MEQLTMICRGCGKTIPLIGKVCPHCQRDKTADAEEHSRSYLIIMGGCIVGLILGFAVTDGFLANIAGAFVGTFVGGLIAMVVSLATGSSKTESQPPEVRIAQQSKTSQESQAPEPSAEARLSNLETLRAKGMVSPEEYAEKRSEILRSL